MDNSTSFYVKAKIKGYEDTDFMVSPSDDKFIISIDAEELAIIYHQPENDTWKRETGAITDEQAELFGDAIEKYYK